MKTPNTASARRSTCPTVPFRPITPKRHGAMRNARYIARMREWQSKEAAYQWIQGTRPQTLSYGLTDSPAGLAAWIVEKWRSWADCGGDIETRFSMDEILTNISIYWFTRTMNSATRYYYERRQHDRANALPGPLRTPAGFSVFPEGNLRPPKALGRGRIQRPAVVGPRPRRPLRRNGRARPPRRRYPRLLPSAALGPVRYCARITPATHSPAMGGT